MFWEQDVGKEENSLVQLLKQEGVELNLGEVLDDPNLLQELRANNAQLIAFLTRPDNLLQIVNTALRPDIDVTLPPKEQFRHAHICSDILTVRNYEDPFKCVVEREECIEALRHFFEDNEQMNPLVAGFYTKILNQFVSKYFKQMLSVLEGSSFVEKCLANIRFGAISELLQTFIRLPQTYEESDKLKQWLLSQSFNKRLLTLLDPSQPECVLENVAETYCEILRDLREKLYSNDEKIDPLQDEMQSDETIHLIVNAMFKTDENGECYPALLCAGAEMIGVLIETNYVQKTPSQQLDAERQAGEMDTWRGGRPGDMNGEGEKEDNTDEEKAEAWRPDKERRAETALVHYADRIIQYAIADLKKSDNRYIWNEALRLIVLLLDTNHLPTHEALLIAFRKAQFEQLLDLAWELPVCSIFHRQLHLIVSYPLYAVFPEKVDSPLIHYFLKEIDLPERILRGISSVSALSRLYLISLRTHHINLALQLVTAAKQAANGSSIDLLLKEFTKWPEVEDVVKEFVERNKSDIESDTSVLSSARSHAINTLDSELAERSSRFDELAPFADFSDPPLLADAFDAIPFDQQIALNPSEDFLPQFPVIDETQRENSIEADFDAFSRLELDSTTLDAWPLSQQTPAVPASLNSSFSPSPNLSSSPDARLNSPSASKSTA